jgi:uncharacterized protein YjhX (UPF0386 family)
MNVSKREQRTLHALAQGGIVVLKRDDRGDIARADCLTREGWALTDCDVALFKRLKRRGFIASRGGGPYRITRDGLLCLRSQLDNRVSARGW